MRPDQLPRLGAPPLPSPSSPQAHSERIAREHYENFPVVTRLFPARLRAAMYAVYAFCRYTDDIGRQQVACELYALITQPKNPRQ